MAKPNVLLVISDQQRADTMPGETRVPAHIPHLTWLAERGATFERAYCASPLCTPARASILTGLFPHTTGVVANYDTGVSGYAVPDETRLIADYLAPAGYACGYSGKWHLPTGNDRRGFRDFVARLTKWDVDDEGSDEAVGFARKLGIDIGDTYTKYLDTGARLPTGGGATRLPLAFHPSTLMAQRAAEFVRRMADDDRPFLLVYSCIEPHPLGMEFNISPCPFDRMYDPKDMYVPETCRDPGAPRVVGRRNYTGLKPTDDFSDDEIRSKIAGYHGAVSYVDHLLGIILEALISTDQMDDTLVIFTSDHGEMLADHRMLKKGPVMFEEMIRIPFLVVPPAEARSGTVRSSRMVSHVDLVPTILGFCGVEAPSALPGCDISGLIAGQDRPVRDGLAVEYHSVHWGGTPWPLRAWCTEECKYVETVGGDDELYHLIPDPRETDNLAGLPAAEDRKRVMKQALDSWVRRSGDPWPEVPVPDKIEETRPGPWADLAALESKGGS